MNISSEYFSPEKISSWIMPVMNVGLMASGIKSSAKENLVKARLTPLDQDESYKLQSPYAYQFEGGKHLPTKPVIGPGGTSGY